MLLCFKTKATSFQNEGDRKVTAVEFACCNRPTLMHMGIVMKAQNDWRDIGSPSSCNAFAIATLSSCYISHSHIDTVVLLLHVYFQRSRIVTITEQQKLDKQ